MRLAIGSDHVGYEMKPMIIDHLRGLGHEVTDMGAFGPERTDYPDFGEKVARAVAAGEFELGILICGTGIGISIAANKIRGIRAAVCSEPYSARLTRQHNNANILAFGARVIGPDVAKMIVDEFLTAEFEGGRHQTRIDKITALEAGD